jgi:hypothetical protein
MHIKLLLFGEAVNIPFTAIGMGVSLLNVWIDDSSYTCASNNIGALGYIFLETPEIDVGELDAELAQQFSDLHNQVVTFVIQPNVFAGREGIARISMSVGVSDQKLEYMADDCTGVAVVSNKLEFFSKMLRREQAFADLASETIISDEEMTAIIEQAPTDEDEVPA